MPITAACPKCNSRYQFDVALLGQRIRCTNPDCREIFEVREAEAKSSRRARRAPTFDADSGEHEVLPAAAPAAEVPREADWTKLPPPPVRAGGPAAPEPIFELEPEPDPGVASADEALAFMGVSAEDAAPADLDGEGEVIYEATAAEPAEPDYAALYGQFGHRPRRRWMAYLVLGMFLVAGVAVFGAFMYIKSVRETQLAKLVEEADQALKAKQYKVAETKYDDLITKDDQNAARYRFLRDYARAMAAATDPAEPSDKRKTDLAKYLRGVLDSAEPERINEFGGDVRDAFVRIAQDELREADKRADARDFAAAAEFHRKADNTQKFIGDYAPAGGPAVPHELSEKFQAVAAKISEGQRYLAFVGRIDARLKKELSPAAVTDVKRQAKEEGYDNRQEVVELLKKAEAELLARIVFKADEQPAEPPPAAALNSLILGPNTDPLPAAPSVVFAVARGVLYALAEGKGQLLWAARVGVDAGSLPLRVPKAGSIPELVLAPSADGAGLVAREALTGKARWSRRLSAPPRGRPLLVEGRVIAPLADEMGTVVVLEARDGQQLGYIRLNQRVGAGAALQPGSARVFVPADSRNVFVLDANPPPDGGASALLKLVAMLPTGHGPGSLRAEPVVVGGVDEATGQPAGTGYMILTQSDGFKDMRLRSFELTHLPDGQLLATPAGTDQRLPGWCWFAPVCDQERVAVVTDAGALAVLGINQKQNQDPALFPLVVSQPEGRPAGVGRGQIVHAEEQGYWYLANGELNYRIKGFNTKDGPTLAAGWKQPLRLGTPLHEAQVSADRATLYVVTQTAAPPAWQMTAVNAQTGEIVWQRPLGLAAQGDPAPLGGLVYQLDQGAGIYAADPKGPTAPAGEAALGGQVLARPRADVVGEPYLLPHPDGKLAFAVYATGDGRQLNAVVLVPGQKAGEPYSVTLAAPLAGAPVLADKSLIMPLADGGLHRWTIGEMEVKRGTDWRGRAENARCFLTLLGKDLLLATDGQRTLTLYQWPAGSEPVLKQQRTVQDRIIAAPVALPTKDGTPRVAVADAGGRVSLLEGEALEPGLRWDVRALRKGNEITAGPFLADDQGQPRIIIVADRTTVLCLSPDDRREVWSYRVKGDGMPLAPRQVGEALVIADVSGRFEALGVADGRLAGGPYPPLAPLPAAPAAAPAPFGPDRLFAPLTDGTVLLIPADALLPKK